MSVSTMLPVYKKVDKLMLPVMWLLFVISLFLSTLNDTWHLSFFIGLPLAVIPTILIFTKPGQLITRSIVAISLMAFMGLHIHQANGMTELHFGIFVLLAILLSYTDWKVIIIAALTIAIHHLSFNFFQQLAWGPICFTEPNLNIVLLHATYVVVEAGMLSYLAIIMNKIISSGVQLSVTVEDVTKLDGQINLVLSQDIHDIGISKTLKEMLLQLHATVSHIREQVSSISTSALSIAQGNSEIATQSELQLLNLQKTVNSVEVLTQTVQKNTDNILKAHELMLMTVKDAEQGGVVVSQVINKMKSINDSSSKITEITSVIDGIAFQTNILALNATIEAARAGTQGRSFAVVANEVRNLAQRSAQAAKEIKDLINTSVLEVEEGNELVKNAGNSINSIVSSVNCVKDIMQEISEASQIQTKEIQDTNKLLYKIQDSNEQHDQLIMNTASLAADIQQQTTLLEQDMTVFKLY